MKPTRDPVTGYPAIQIMNQTIVLQKGTSLEEAMQKPAQEVIECAI